MGRGLSDLKVTLPELPFAECPRCHRRYPCWFADGRGGCRRCWWRRTPFGDPLPEPLQVIEPRPGGFRIVHPPGSLSKAHLEELTRLAKEAHAARKAAGIA
jgi:hypothetical protein